ncbi:hypothetical protein A2U01_0084397, partial [Trifolium medium]|nr:hypothetical protein [Trifolium medium]
MGCLMNYLYLVSVGFDDLIKQSKQ